MGGNDMSLLTQKFKFLRKAEKSQSVTNKLNKVAVSGNPSTVIAGLMTRPYVPHMVLTVLGPVPGTFM